MPRIILDQYTSTRIIRDQLTHSCINPNTQTFPLLLDWKSENRTKRSAFLNKGACRGQPEGLRYFGGAFSDGYTCGGQVEGWRYAGRGHPGMCLPLGSAASPKRNGIPMFPRRDLCARKSKSDKSGQVGTCQVWFLSKRGGSVATLGTTPAHPYLLWDLNEGTTNREMASPQSQTEQDNHSKPLCGLNVNQNGSYMDHQLCCLDSL